MKKDDVAPKSLNGVVIVSFNNSPMGEQDQGFAIILDTDLSILETVTFGRGEQDILDTVIKSTLRNSNSVGFLTREPSRLREWYPGAEDVGSLKWLASKFGIDLDRYFGKKGIYDQAFDMLDLLVREAGI